MTKNIVLTEKRLEKIINESISRAIKEGNIAADKNYNLRRDKNYKLLQKMAPQAIKMLDEIVYLLYELPNEEAQTLAANADEWLDEFDGFIAH